MGETIEELTAELAFEFEKAKKKYNGYDSNTGHIYKFHFDGAFWTKWRLEAIEYIKKNHPSFANEEVLDILRRNWINEEDFGKILKALGSI